MLNYNFVKIITLIWTFLLFFAPSAYAHMQKISEDDLAQIDAESGISLGLNLTVNMVASNVGIYTDPTKTEGINLPSFKIGDGANLDNAFGVNTTVTLDVGTNAGRTWLKIGGLSLPSNASGIGISSTGINIVDSAGNRTLGNLDITGLYMGQNVTAAHYTTTPSYIQLASHAGGGKGIDAFAEVGMYIDDVEFTYKTGTALSVNGIYLCSASSATTGVNDPTTPNTWTPTGNAKIGNFLDPSGTNTLYATVDVGTNAGVTSLQLGLPMQASIRVKDFQMDPARSWGPMAFDNLILYKANISLHAL